jgi:O-antigen/teichoic acid export membrane protein
MGPGRACRTDPANDAPGMIRHIAKANAILLFQYAAGALVPLLLVPHIVRSIGLANYGHLAVALAWAGFGGLITQYAFQLTGPQRLAGDPSATDTILADVVVGKATLLAVVLPLMVLVAATQAPPGAAGTGSWLVLLLVPIGAAANASWFLQFQGRFLRVALAAIAGSCGALALGWWWVAGSGTGSVVGAAVSLSFGGVFVGLVTLCSAWRLAGLRRDTVRNSRPLPLLREDWPLFASQLASALYTVAGPILINQVAGASSAGSYSAVERVVNALAAACQLTYVAAYPRLASSYVNDRRAYWRLLTQLIGAHLAATTLLAGIIWTCREPLSAFIFGTTAEDTRSLLAWGLGWLVVGIFGPALTGYLTLSHRKPKVMSLNLAVLGICVLVGIPAIAAFGPTGWMATLVCSQLVVLMVGIHYWRSRDEAQET